MMHAIPWLIGAAVLLLALWWFWWRRIERKGWSIGPLVHGGNYSRNMPETPDKLKGGVWTTTIKPGAELDGITIARGPITGGIRLRYRVTGVGLYPSENASDEPILTLYFQREGDGWQANEKYRFYRWYSIEGFPLTPGLHEVTLPFDPTLWACVAGPGAWETGTTLDGFHSAMAANGRIGLAFGHAGGRMHGVETTAPVTIDLLEWIVGEPALSGIKENGNG